MEVEKQNVLNSSEDIADSRASRGVWQAQLPPSQGQSRNGPCNLFLHWILQTLNANSVQEDPVESCPIDSSH